MSKMSNLSAVCNVCQSELRPSKSRMHERMLALSMDQETKEVLHAYYVNMLKQESVENEKKQGGGRNINEKTALSAECRISEEEGKED